MGFTNCFITKLPFDNTVRFHPVVDNVHKYDFKIVGRVYITDHARIMLERNDKYDRFALAGICRAAFELNKEPPLIDSFLLNDLENNYNYPRTFAEKSMHFLNLLYETGGKENKSFTLDGLFDYSMAFASSNDEFSRIIDYLKKSEFVEWQEKIVTEEGFLVYVLGLELTKKGIEYIDKSQTTLLGLLNQNIKTGDSHIDNKILHAHNLFFKENSSLDDKRSACEALSFILEPYRKDLEEYFSDKDIAVFFRMVNEFDIRHNKTHVSKLIYTEQLEWIFYTLLNTILTFIKLKKRFK